MEDIILVGYGGHAKSVADSIEQAGKYRIIGYTDMECHESRYEYLGPDDVLKKYYDEGCKNAFVCVGYLGKGHLRDKLYELLKDIGYELPIIIDSSSIVADDVTIGEGTFVGKRAVINANSNIGKMCIINTAAVIEHDNTIGDFAHISVGTVLCGQVVVDDFAFVGANATVIQGRHIGEGQIIPAGAVIRRKHFERGK